MLGSFVIFCNDLYISGSGTSTKFWGRENYLYRKTFSPGILSSFSCPSSLPWFFSSPGSTVFPIQFAGCDRLLRLRRRPIPTHPHFQLSTSIPIVPPLPAISISSSTGYSGLPVAASRKTRSSYFGLPSPPAMRTSDNLHSPSLCA